MFSAPPDSQNWLFLLLIFTNFRTTQVLWFFVLPKPCFFSGGSCLHCHGASHSCGCGCLSNESRVTPLHGPSPWAASSCWAVGGLCWCVGKRRGFQRFTESQNILGLGGPTRGIESNSFLSWALECSHTSSGLVRVKAVERSDLRNRRCWGFYSLHT